MAKNPSSGEKKSGEKEQEEKIALSKEEHEKLLAQAKELESLRDKLLRTAADYDNARKRLAKERDEFVRFSQENLLRGLLPILDNFERALAHVETAEPSVAAGVQLIWKQLLDLLTSQGLKRFSCEGSPFDPHFHEAVDHVEEAEGPEGVIVKEITPGYLFQERVLRPAKVRIRVRPSEKEKEEEIT